MAVAWLMSHLQTHFVCGLIRSVCLCASLYACDHEFRDTVLKKQLIKQCLPAKWFTSGSSDTDHGSVYSAPSVGEEKPSTVP